MALAISALSVMWPTVFAALRTRSKFDLLWGLGRRQWPARTPLRRPGRGPQRARDQLAEGPWAPNVHHGSNGIIDWSGCTSTASMHPSSLRLLRARIKVGSPNSVAASSCWSLIGAPSPAAKASRIGCSTRCRRDPCHVLSLGPWRGAGSRRSASVRWIPPGR